GAKTGQPAPPPQSPRLAMAALGAVALLVAAAGVVGFQVAARSLKADILAALGPRGELDELHIGLRTLVLTGVRVKAPDGWPVARALEVAKAVVVPDRK